ncbi:hypothetical protein [Amycolatopsis sp. GM8]|uniref:hypothetical protein n=1 Tax=Amycolatopsis sp. GM8 TaxID=2896530 RepID=UPI001F25858D|nr:hypothetical protein [Amycolatopsis sp. GM8]
MEVVPGRLPGKAPYRGTTMTGYQVPILRSRFPSPGRHPAHAEIYAHCKAFCEDVLHPIARTRYDTVRGTYPDTGAGYCSLIYPTGRTDQVKRLACFYSLWTFIDATRVLRTIQINREPLGPERYVDLRHANVAAPAMVTFIGYVRPELAGELLAAMRTGTCRTIERHLGTCWGIALDLALIDAGRANVDDWTTVDQVVRRGTPGGRQEAIDASVSWFHQAEQHLVAALAELATVHPAVSGAVRDIEAGTMTWIEESRRRGLRYDDPA